MIRINLEIKDAKKFNELEIGDYFIFIEKNVKISCLNQKLNKDTFDDSQNKLKLIGNDIYLPVIKVNLNNYIFADDSLLENKESVTPSETKVKEKCNHRFGNELFLMFSQNNHIFCGECYLHLGTIINKPIFNNSKLTQKGLIVLNKSKERYLEEFQGRFINCEIGTVEDRYINSIKQDFKPLSKSDEQHLDLISEIHQNINQSSSIDQTSIINNQASKIAAQEAEIKRLEKIIINQAEIIGNKSNG